MGPGAQLLVCRRMALNKPMPLHQPSWPLLGPPGLTSLVSQGPASPPHLHRVQVLALEGHSRLMVHGDDHRAGVQELRAVVLLGRAGLVRCGLASAEQPGPRVPSRPLTMWARTMPSSGLGEASRHSW